MDFRCIRTEVADECGEIVSVRSDDAVANLDGKNHEVCVFDICGTRVTQDLPHCTSFAQRVLGVRLSLLCIE